MDYYETAMCAIKNYHFPMVGFRGTGLIRLLMSETIVWLGLVRRCGHMPVKSVCISIVGQMGIFVSMPMFDFYEVSLTNTCRLCDCRCHGWGDYGPYLLLHTGLYCASGGSARLVLSNP